MSVLEYNLPFAVAFALLLLVAVAQVAGLGDVAAEPELDAADAGPMEGLASILGFGRLPFMAWLAIFLLMFSGIGVSGQLLASELIGTMVHPLLAAGLALVSAFALTGIGSRILAPIVPRDETTAVRIESLLGKRGRIDVGSARRGHPARALVQDAFGQPHNVMVEPHEDGAEFLAGDEVLLVRLENDLFFAISTSDRRLGPVT